MKYDSKGPLPQDLWLAVCEAAEAWDRDNSKVDISDYLDDCLCNTLDAAFQALLLDQFSEDLPTKEIAYSNLMQCKFYLAVRLRFEGRDTNLYSHFDTPKGNQVDAYIAEYLADI